MKILIHALSAKMGGAKRHLDNMMISLLKQRTEHSFIVLVNDRYDTSYFDKKVETLRIDIRYVSGLKRIYFDNVLLRRVIKEHRADYLFFSVKTSDTYTLRPNWPISHSEEPL